MKYDYEITRERRRLKGDRDGTETICTITSLPEDCGEYQCRFNSEEEALEAARKEFAEVAEDAEVLKPKYGSALGGYEFYQAIVYEQTDDGEVFSGNGFDNVPEGWEDEFTRCVGTYHEFLDYQEDDYDAFRPDFTEEA